ncbi:sodium:calcium antiporter [Oricola indica]|jgi:cation:H+ antiporter|uniref:sodium:calcium antiporter n=1 Tax=Oricola indica TaxID=2872591 RepID=UPI001CBC2CC5|nr:sodium:calcium antiporter [Oricola indica]
MTGAIENAPVTVQIAIFIACGGVIVIAGSKLAFVADMIADQTGFGEAITGAVLLGAATSLPGVITSVVTAADGYPSLAYSNAVGGIAAQTLFLVFADMTHRRANLEHAAASLVNIVNATLLIVLLALMLSAATGPAISVFGIHPVSIICFAIYLFGLRFAQSARDEPMWRATETEDTHADIPDADAEKTPLARTLAIFALCLLAVSAAGYGVATTGVAFVSSLGVPESLVGTLMTSTVTSLPELVTTIAAVRAGALQLAVGGILGGNAFDTLFASFADIAYRDGSIYNAISTSDIFLTAMVTAMTGVLILGLLRREKRGPGGIGFEGWSVAGLYVAAVGGVFALS